jgi:hypothetical protein
MLALVVKRRVHTPLIRSDSRGALTVLLASICRPRPQSSGHGVQDSGFRFWVRFEDRAGALTAFASLHLLATIQVFKGPKPEPETMN